MNQSELEEKNMWQKKHVIIIIMWPVACAGKQARENMRQATSARKRVTGGKRGNKSKSQQIAIGFGFLLIGGKSSILILIGRALVCPKQVHLLLNPFVENFSIIFSFSRILQSKLWCSQLLAMAQFFSVEGLFLDVSVPRHFKDLCTYLSLVKLIWPHREIQRSPRFPSHLYPLPALLPAREMLHKWTGLVTKRVVLFLLALYTKTSTASI